MDNFLVFIYKVFLFGIILLCILIIFILYRITNHVFDPRPANDSQRLQTLAGLLNVISPLFKKNFSSIQRTT